MAVIIAVLIGTLFAAAFFLLLSRQMQQLLFGLLLMSHAANLLIFTAAGLVRGAVPIAAEQAERLTEPYPDPLPQALILTAIVINFGITAFTLVLAHLAHRTAGTDTVDDPPESEP